MGLAARSFVLEAGAETLLQAASPTDKGPGLPRLTNKGLQMCETRCAGREGRQSTGQVVSRGWGDRLRQDGGGPS